MKTIALSLLTLTLITQALVAESTSILFIAGKDSHKWGAHEYSLGCEVLAKAIDESGIKNIKTTVHRDGWPEDESIFNGVNAVIIYSDGDSKHAALTHEQKLIELSNKGIGIACLHYAVASDTEALDNALSTCIGGRYEKHWSVNPTWVMEKPTLADHPITRGVKPFSAKDEFYYHMRFRKDMQGITPILSALPSIKTLGAKDGAHSGNPALRKELQEHKLQHLAWASKNANQSRGFGYTGGHFHTGWAHDDVRKMILNAILWTAGLEVPKNGVESKRPIITTHESLVKAIGKGDLKDIKRHIQNGSDVNDQNSSGWTPLHYAAVRGNTDAAAILLKNGAQPDAKTNTDKTALHFAADRNFSDLAKLLIEKGAHITIGDNEGWSPLHFAAAKDNTEVAKVLINKGAKVNLQSKRGGTPLHEGAASAGTELMNLLLDNGADRSMKAQNGKTALDYAVELKNENAEKALRTTSKR